VDEHLRVDSCDLTPHQMLGIALRTREVLRERELDGLVVTHGSDALEETSFLCDLLVDGERLAGRAPDDRNGRPAETQRRPPNHTWCIGMT
jgi:Asparaginase, N-terminal